jgi:putative flippase GtrA
MASPDVMKPRMTGAQIALRYAAFAVIATVVNLGAQRLVLAYTGDSGGGLTLAILAGTGVGLVVKYVLDKRWIFFDQSSGVAAHGKRFSLYTAMGIVTTLIFWGFEAGFWYMWRTSAMREAGAILGLAIGYCVKYELDRRFVFGERSGAR